MLEQSTTSPGSAALGHAAQEAPLSQLRQRIQRIERRHAGLEDAAPALTFGLAPVDAVLGGLSPAALHEIAAASEREIAAAAGFALALTARTAPRALLWIAEDMALRESGAPYGPGFDEIGLAPETLLIVAAVHARDVLWAMEEALRCRAVGAVVGEIRKPGLIDRVAGRRLSLAAAREQRMAVLLHAQPTAQPSPAATRWIVSAAPSRSSPQSTGPPAFAAQLVRSRNGRVGSWVLEWNRVAQCFEFASTYSQSVAETPADRLRAAGRVA
jgi:protein ImuA